MSLLHEVNFSLGNDVKVGKIWFKSIERSAQTAVLIEISFIFKLRYCNFIWSSGDRQKVWKKKTKYLKSWSGNQVVRAEKRFGTLLMLNDEINYIKLSVFLFGQRQLLILIRLAGKTGWNENEIQFLTQHRVSLN